MEVCVRNPGPIAEVAIRKAAPNMTERLGLAAGVVLLLIRQDSFSVGQRGLPVIIGQRREIPKTRFW